MNSFLLSTWEGDCDKAPLLDVGEGKPTTMRLKESIIGNIKLYDTRGHPDVDTYLGFYEMIRYFYGDISPDDMFPRSWYERTFTNTVQRKKPGFMDLIVFVFNEDDSEETKNKYRTLRDKLAGNLLSITRLIKKGGARE